MEPDRPSLRFFYLVLRAKVRNRVTAAAYFIAEEHGVLSIGDLQVRGLRAVRTMGENLTRDGGDAHLGDDFIEGAIIYTACEAMASYALQHCDGPTKSRIAKLWTAIKASNAWERH